MELQPQPAQVRHTRHALSYFSESPYRAHGWPAGTPEYLLRGYYRLLTATDDLTRMTNCGTDAARHDRMLDMSGGDAAALAETRITLDRIAGQDHPDLIAALRLAHHRDQLADRNRKVPTELPAVWAQLGHMARADALARSIPDPYQQANALTTIAQAPGSLRSRECPGQQRDRLVGVPGERA